MVKNKFGFLHGQLLFWSFDSDRVRTVKYIGEGKGNKCVCLDLSNHKVLHVLSHELFFRHREAHLYGLLKESNMIGFIEGQKVLVHGARITLESGTKDLEVLIDGMWCNYTAIALNEFEESESRVNPKTGFSAMHTTLVLENEYGLPSQFFEVHFGGRAFLNSMS